MLVAVLFYAFPISLISGEFAGMFPQKGGPELWVSESLGRKWGFVVSWLLWVQMFPGMVMVASALAPLFGNIIDNVPLGLNSKFTLVVILVVYWIITLLNLKFDMAKIGGKIGVWLGLYIPLAMMLLLGFVAWIKVGYRTKWNIRQFFMGQINSRSYYCKLICLFCTDHVYFYWNRNVLCLYHSIEKSS